MGGRFVLELKTKKDAFSSHAGIEMYNLFSSIIVHLKGY